MGERDKMDGYGLIKLTEAYRSLRRDADIGRVAHAYLIVSPDPVTGDMLADLFVARLLFGSDESFDAERVKKSGADLIRLPHGDKVLTSDAEELADTVYFTPTEHDRKFYIVSRAETMNDASQNKILKVLEEPPAHVVVILKSTGKNELLPTVVSRVRTVEVDPLPDDALYKYLSDAYGADKARAAFELCGGYLGRAEAAAEDNRTMRSVDLAFSVLTGMTNSRSVLGYSAKIMARKDDVPELVTLIESVLADAMAVGLGLTDNVRFSGRMDELYEVAREYPPEAVVRLRPAFTRAKARLKLNGNIQSVTDELLFTMTEVKAKCRK